MPSINDIELPEGVELPGEPNHTPPNAQEQPLQAAQAQPAVSAVLYTRDSKKIVFPAGGWEMDQYGVSGRTSETQATIVPHANVSKIVMEFQPEDVA